MFRDWYRGRKPNKANTSESGNRGEQFACRHLDRQGLKILARNVSSRGGEIDIIALDRDVLVFVEVRLRNHRFFANGAESVDFRKQQRIIQTASQYLQKQYNSDPPPCRFDVISLRANTDDDGHYELEWLKDAFRPDA